MLDASPAKRRGSVAEAQRKSGSRGACSEERSFSSRIIQAVGRQPPFRVCGIFQYHFRGNPHSLERGGSRSLLRGNKKSSNCYVVTSRNMLSVRHCKPNIAMKTKLRQTAPQRSSRELLRKRAYRPDPMLRLNISFFNFTDGWAGFSLKSNMDASPL